MSMPACGAVPFELLKVLFMTSTSCEGAIESPCRRLLVDTMRLSTMLPDIFIELPLPAAEMSTPSSR